MYRFFFASLLFACSSNVEHVPSDTTDTPVVEKPTTPAVEKKPTARQTEQAQSVDVLVDALASQSAWHDIVDGDAVKKRTRDAILGGDDSDLTYVSAMWGALNAYPQGHQNLYSEDASVCGKTVPWQHSSRFGVCGRPSSDGVAVTFANAGNKLGLSPGDVVVAVDGTSEDIFERAYARPVCGGVFPAASGRRYSGAASFFGTIPAGAKLSVRGKDGAMRVVTVPDKGDTKTIDCTDPFARNRQIYAEATRRPDGVAVIRLPSFFPFDKTIPTSADDFAAFVEAYQNEIVKVFDTVKNAPAIIWDTRGNTGGITTVGLAIVGGFASSHDRDISYCRSRDFNSPIPKYTKDRYAEYNVTHGGPFAYAGQVAVVTDGLAYSAGDYFPYAVAKASNAFLIGSASAGAYGGGNGPIELKGPPSLIANYDPTACFDAETSTPLEGNPLPPTLDVEYDSASLAAGKDPVIERAVQALGFSNGF